MTHRRWARKFHRFLTLFLWAFAFGGFLFYAGVVVPIASEVVGSTTQGFVTRRVTFALNIVSSLAMLSIFCEIWLGRGDRQKIWQRVLLISSVTAAGLTVALWWLHPLVDAMLLEDEFGVTDPQRFYQLHRIYLWVSTIQWLSALVILWVLAREQTP